MWLPRNDFFDCGSEVGVLAVSSVTEITALYFYFKQYVPVAQLEGGKRLKIVTVQIRILSGTPYVGL